MAKYKVIIIFREPSFEIHRKIKRDSPFTIDYTIEAPNEKEARERAVAKFRKTEEESSVHWGRNILEIVVKKRI